MSLAHFKILIHEMLNKDPYIVTEEAPLIILDSKPYVYMSNSGNDTKHTRNIARRVNFGRSSEKLKMHKIDCFEGGIYLADVATNNVG